jgi:hypothetical protein
MPACLALQLENNPLETPYNIMNLKMYLFMLMFAPTANQNLVDDTAFVISYNIRSCKRNDTKCKNIFPAVIITVN